MKHTHTATISPEAILSGIGKADRVLIATYLALLAAGDSLTIMKGAVKDLGKKLRLLEEDTAAQMQDRIQTITASPVTDDELRHHLWVALTKSLDAQGETPFSPRSARMSASALAVRASERLSPTIRKTRELEEEKRTNSCIAHNISWSEKLGANAASRVRKLKSLLHGTEPLPFPTIVEEEILALMQDTAIMEQAEQVAATKDPQLAEAVKEAHQAAQLAMAAGGGWAMFAAIVANAGFTPYILAAQASAWVPLVGGKTLVSLLAVLVSPVTLIVGLGAIVWLGAGKTGDVVRSAIASRVCVLLAIGGQEKPEEGVAGFLDSMRTLTRAPESKMAHLSKSERRAFRRHAAIVTRHLGKPIFTIAGTPPAPWNRRLPPTTTKAGLTDALLAGTLTAGEMYWHAASINPDVIAAADFCRIDDLGDPVSFAANAQMFASDAAGYSLRGYTAERLVMNRLIADGRAVSLAPDSNTAGLDLMVDGSPVQIKCGGNISNLTEHFEKYPDIPVIANAELALQAWERGEDWADLVSTVPGFEIAGIEADLVEALGHAASIADPGVVELALELGLLRGGLEAWRGRVPLTDLPAWMIMNAGAKGVLAFAGGKVGWLAGLVAVGPAGAVIFGPAVACAALIGAMPLQGAATRVLLRDWHVELLSLAADLHAQLRLATEARIRELSARSEAIRARTARDGSTFGRWLGLRSDDDLIAAIEELASMGEPPRTAADVPSLIVTAALLAPGVRAVLLSRKRLERHLLRRPELIEVVGKRAMDLARRSGSHVPEKD
ncbi:hypothetical protein [Sedimentimonas flavescens]|uniref:hypothetical protein n=1 Tax=Sedimentimonas flavescens TaxID=2851012 RepID=UPI001C4A65E2|nr:hypothetical protein [Sedimentimonas flavescens]MBW0157619.1 hypothetical protein [Sedimentimonas flavescens]